MSSAQNLSSTASQTYKSQEPAGKGPYLEIHAIKKMWESQNKIHVHLTYTLDTKKTVKTTIDKIECPRQIGILLDWAAQHAPHLLDHDHWSAVVGSRKKDSKADATLTDSDEEGKQGQQDEEQINTYTQPKDDPLNQPDHMENVEDGFGNDPLEELLEGDDLEIEVDVGSEDFNLLMGLGKVDIKMEQDPEWQQGAKEVGYDSQEDIDYSKMVKQTSEEFMASNFNAVFRSFCDSPLYDPPAHRDYKKLFADPFWHPGLTDQNKHHCLIHAMNSYLGGPIFDDVSKFVALYESRAHMIKTRRPEMMEEIGVSLKNLDYAYYNYDEQLWYSPVLIQTISGVAMNLVRTNVNYTLAAHLKANLKDSDRYIFQMIVQNRAKKNGSSQIQFHAGALVKDADGEWVILDCAEKEKIHMKGNPKLVLEWLQNVKVLNIYEFKPEKPSDKVRDDLLREWELIMEGKMLVKRVPPTKKRMSSRRLSRKDFRKYGVRPGDAQFRVGKNVVPSGKQKPDKATQLLGKRQAGPIQHLADVAKKELTKKAREVKKGQKELKQLMSSNKSGSPVKSPMEANHTLVKKLFEFVTQIKAMVPTPTFVECNEKLLKRDGDEEVLHLAYRFHILSLQKQQKDPLFETVKQQLENDAEHDYHKGNDDDKQLFIEKKIEEWVKNASKHLIKFIKDLYKHCPRTPVSIMKAFNECLDEDFFHEITVWHDNKVQKEIDGVYKSATDGMSRDEKKAKAGMDTIGKERVDRYKQKK